MSILACFAVMMIAGLFSAAPALAHNGHSHAASTVSQAAAPVASDEVALAVAELARDAGDELPANSGASPVKGDTVPCDGHCCANASSHCCGLLSVSLHLARWEYIVSPCLGEWSAQSLDGLGPDALLRPPKSLI